MSAISLHIIEDTLAGAVAVICMPNRVQAIISHHDGSDLPGRMCSVLVSEFGCSQAEAESRVAAMTAEPEADPEPRPRRRRASKSE